MASALITQSLGILRESRRTSANFFESRDHATLPAAWRCAGVVLPLAFLPLLVLVLLLLLLILLLL